MQRLARLQALPVRDPQTEEQGASGDVRRGKIQEKKAVKIDRADWERAVEEKMKAMGRPSLLQKAHITVIEEIVIKKSHLDRAMSTCFGMVDHFVPLGIPQTQRTKKQEEIATMVQARLATVREDLEKGGAQDVQWTFSAKRTFFRGFTTRNDWSENLVLYIPPGCTMRRRETEGRQAWTFRKANDGVLDLRRRIQRLEVEEGRKRRATGPKGGTGSRS